MMEQTKFEGLKEFTKGLIGKYSIKDLVAEVYNLYQDYLVNEDQETELYSLVDPEDKENSPAELWYDGYGCVEMYDYLR